MWMLSPKSSRIKVGSDTQMQVLTFIITRKSSTPSVQIPNVTNVKMDGIDDGVSTSDDNVCFPIHLFNRMCVFSKKTTMIASIVSMDVNNTLYIPLHMSIENPL